MDQNGDYAEIIDEMMESMDEVNSGEITTATRSIEINGVTVKKGEVISLLNGKLVNSSKSIFKSCSELLKIADTQEMEHITIFYGDNVNKEMVEKLIGQIEKEYPDHEIEVHSGGQPHYQFILSIE